ncbi:tRNA3(Ser)-specific nuclease WapA precursor [Planctomycetes bacterium Pan216]|uniref:tRNA3(Ser)-specific nuclease WapA n=1 Tax=Kolteria novifilia TaxID=2527975 RepID=A0A518AYZ2_9BACT|nr:tRNA3(Ser)-specific nuclease WapA precursor [Planctomycetes bacterium Pan216]
MNRADDLSRIVSVEDIDGTLTFDYDDTYQLTSATHDSDSSRNESYAYDANGNRESSHLHATGYVTGFNNRLLSDGIYDYDYDDEGNRVRQTEIATGSYREFDYDHRNRLVALVDNDQGGVDLDRVDFVYDVFDRRIAKSVDFNGDGNVDVSEHYIQDREDVLLDFVDPDGSGTGGPVFSNRYLHGTGIDQVLAQDDGVNVEWLLHDHLGTTKDIVDSSGAVVNHLIYDSFGNVVNQSNSLIEVRYKFTGREYDDETGLYYYRARYYDATKGGFISEDPIGFAGRDTNLTRYATNSPTMLSDPSGLWTLGIGPSATVYTGILRFNVSLDFHFGLSWEHGLSGGIIVSYAVNPALGLGGAVEANLTATTAQRVEDLATGTTCTVGIDAGPGGCEYQQSVDRVISDDGIVMPAWEGVQVTVDAGLGGGIYGGDSNTLIGVCGSTGWPDSLIPPGWPRFEPFPRRRAPGR